MPLLGIERCYPAQTARVNRPAPSRQIRQSHLRIEPPSQPDQLRRRSCVQPVFIANSNINKLV
jgi:hypothetical protein